MSYDTRLREARKRAGLTQEELGKIVGCAKTTITGYETGKSEPNMAILSKIMDALKVDANFIFQDEMREHHEYHATPDEMETLVKKYRLLNNSWKLAIQNILDLASTSILVNNNSIAVSDPEKNFFERQRENCSFLQLSEQPASAGTGVYLGPEAFRSIKVVKNDKTRRAAFCVRISGDSMEPLFSDGDIIMVSRDSVQVGDIALVTLNGNGFIKRMGNKCLISENKKYAPIPCNEETIINGRVIGILNPEWIIEM